jgi:hypothetical protein
VLQLLPLLLLLLLPPGVLLLLLVMTAKRWHRSEATARFCLGLNDMPDAAAAACAL